MGLFLKFAWYYAILVYFTVNNELFEKLQITVKYLWQLIGISKVKPTSNNVANIYINPEKKNLGQLLVHGSFVFII